MPACSTSSWSMRRPTRCWPRWRCSRTEAPSHTSSTVSRRVSTRHLRHRPQQRRVHLRPGRGLRRLSRRERAGDDRGRRSGHGDRLPGRLSHRCADHHRLEGHIEGRSARAAATTDHAVRMAHPTQVEPERWANGGGWTRTLLAWPDPARWALRISVADVEQRRSVLGVSRCRSLVRGARGRRRASRDRRTGERRRARGR